MMEKAKNGANRLNSLLERHLDSAELSDSIGSVRTKALARLSRKFYGSAREMMDNFNSRYGEGSKKALAQLVSIAVRKEDFSINYDSWLGSIAKLADALNQKGIDIACFFQFSFSCVLRECETLGELDVAVRAIAEYDERLGHPDSFCKDNLCKILRLRLPPAELAEFCDAVVGRLAEMPSEGERSEFRRKLAKKLDECSLMAPEKAKKLLDFVAG
jgi:hypothetical protein